jgi:hypothetical protein
MCETYKIINTLPDADAKAGIMGIIIALSYVDQPSTGIIWMQ